MTPAADSTLHIAVVHNDIGLVRSLLGGGADANGKNAVGRTALCLTVNPELITLLLASGADPNLAGGDGFKPLDIAVMSQASSGAVELLLEVGADPNAACPTGFTPLTYACKQGEVYDVRLLVRHGANVHAVDGRVLPSPGRPATARCASDLACGGCA